MKHVLIGILLAVSPLLAATIVPTNIGPLQCGARISTPTTVQSWCNLSVAPNPQVVVQNTTSTVFPGRHTDQQVVYSDVPKLMWYFVQWEFYQAVANGPITYEIVTMQCSCVMDNSNTCVPVPSCPQPGAPQTGTFQ